MTTFTISENNEIVAFATAEGASAATPTPFDSFSSEKELAELAAAWPAERLVAIWNSLAGVTAVKKFKDKKTALSRIWERIQGLGEAAEPAQPQADKKAKRGAKAAKGAPAKAKASKKATSAKKAVKTHDAAGPREGSKTAQVVAMLQRKNGATLSEIMEKMIRSIAAGL